MAGKKSIFSVFFGKAQDTAPQAVSKAQEESDDEPSTNDRKEVIESSVEVGSAKGWPTTATALMYHKISGTICVGTEGGAVYIYGDGFQFVRPWLTEDPNEVVSIVALHPNKILVTFGDNSIVAMELPTLEVIDLLSSSWLPQTYGDITAVHCDAIGEKNFVYLGTSEGVFIVLDVLETMIRVCEFQLAPTDFGLAGKSVSITEIQMCPKDERYVAVAFEGGDLDEGYVVIYDFTKHKVHRQFTLPAVGTLVWNHTGEQLFAGTRRGQIYVVNPEKNTCQKMWSADDEVLGGGDDDDDGIDTVSIRKLSWLAPQDNDGEGCLFLLLGNRGADNDNLQNVLIGLSPTAHGDLSTVFSLPPIPGEKILSFRVVPTYDKTVKAAQQQNPVGTSHVSNPGLLFLTQRQVGQQKGRFERDMKLMRCPTTAISNWGLEIGTLSDPRRATEVQPTSNDISTIAGILPKHDNPLSLGTALITSAGANDDQVVSTASVGNAPALNAGSMKDSTDNTSGGGARRASRRLSYRAFLDSIGEMEAQASSLNDWEMVLVNGEHDETHDRGTSMRKQDVVFLGQKDGTIIGFGVSLPKSGREIGRGGIWLPLVALRCGMTAVTAIAVDEDSGLLAAGDESGVFVLYQVHDDESRVGAVDILHRLNIKLTNDVSLLTSDSSTALSLEDFKENQSLLEYRSIASGYQFSGVKEVFRTRINGHITAVRVLGEFLLVFVGTEDGNILVNSDLRSTLFAKIENVNLTGASGAVKGFTLGFFPSPQGALLTAVYAYFESGHVVVIDIATMTVVYFSVALKMSSLETTEEHEMFDGPVDNFTLLSQNEDGQMQIARHPTLLTHLYCQARGKILANEYAGSNGHSSRELPTENAVAPPPPAPESTTSPKPTRISFFSRKATAPPAAPAASSSSSTTSSQPNSPVPPNAASSDGDVSGGSSSGSTNVLVHEAHHVPRQLSFLHGNSLFTFSLEKFMAVNKRRESLSSVAKGVLSAVSIRKICDQKIVATQCIRLFADDPNEYFAYVGCMDEVGTFRLVSMQSRTVVNVSTLLEGIAEESTVNVFSGLILPNGSNYAVNHGTILYSSYLTFSDCRIADSLPDRANPSARVLPKSLALLHGRESILAKLKSDVKKRRSSVISLTSAPTDLYKIFVKSRDQRLKDTLFSSATHDVVEDTSAVRRNQRASSKLAGDLQQVRENFAERGERINRLALKMDDFKESAAQFKQTAAAHKERLKQSNRNWGLF